MLFINIIIFFASISTTHALTQLNLSSTDYIVDAASEHPSCGLFQKRRDEREKVLREIMHHLSKNKKSNSYLLEDRYITNKYFLDKNLWMDETVKIVHTWNVSDDFIENYTKNSNLMVMQLKSDGILWIEKIAFFPDDVEFIMDEKNKTLMTIHSAYYIDYCKPQVTPRLEWAVAEDVSGVVSTSDNIKEILNETAKENL